MKKVAEYIDRLLGIVDAVAEVSRGDLQGMIEAAVLNIINDN
ncbi:MAG TPA: hypothetical protein VLC46_00180 [Thermoanaerobaculia bacterium]|jgi:hypothetical protein|nr:hypothetical protein [Thermoanaerobaculia bacterium]